MGERSLPCHQRSSHLVEGMTELPQLRGPRGGHSTCAQVAGAERRGRGGKTRDRSMQQSVADESSGENATQQDRHHGDQRPVEDPIGAGEQRMRGQIHGQQEGDWRALEPLSGNRMNEDPAILCPLEFFGAVIRVITLPFMLQCRDKERAG